MVLESKIIVYWTFWYQTQLILGASKSWNFTISVTMWHVTQPILNEIYYLVVHGWHRWVFHKFHLLGYFPPPHEYWWFKVVSFRLVHQQQRLLVRKVEHLTGLTGIFFVIKSRESNPSRSEYIPSSARPNSCKDSKNTSVLHPYWALAILSKTL